jgi:protocatechuate 3,4-dioxygenase beta subunit
MKSSKILLVLWLGLVGLLAFVLVKSLSEDPGSGDPNAPDGGNGAENGSAVEPREVPGEGGRPRVNDRKPRRMTQKILGRVVGPDGAPVAGASVRVGVPVETSAAPETAKQADIKFINDVIYIDPLEWDQPRPLDDWIQNQENRTSAKSGSEEIASTSTGGDGRFEMEIPRYRGAGPFRVTAEAPIGKASAQGVRPGQDIELTVGPVAAATGFVYSGNENIGVAGATVVLDDGEMRFTGVTGGDGGFRIEGVSPGRYSVSAGAEGHPPLLGNIKVVKTGEDIDLRLPRGTTLRVIATYEPEEGPDRPLPGVDVVALEQDTFTYVMGRTDMNGVLELKGMPPGSYLVNGRGDRAVSFGEELVDISGNQLVQEAELLFEPAIDTQLTVVDTSGQPVAGMVFYTANADEEYDALRSQRVPGETDAQGRFTFAFEFEGPRALVFGFKEGFSLVRAYPDAHDDAIPMTLVAHPALRVHGTVRTPEGQPVPDALVLLEVEPEDPEEIDDYVIHIRSGPDGRYDFPYVPRGEIWISAELGDDAWSDDYDVELEQGKTEYKVDLELELE